MGAQVGDKFTAVPYWNDSSPYIHVVITGIFSRNDPEHEYWYLNDRIFKAATSDTFRTLPFYLTEKAYYETLGATFNQMDSVFGWLLMVDTGKLNANNSRFALASIEALEGQTVRQSLQLSAVNRTGRGALRVRPQAVLLQTAHVRNTRSYFRGNSDYVITLSSLVVEQQKGEIVL